jgi:hypothetical protein
MIYPEIAKQQISTKYYTTLSQNSPKRCHFKVIFYIFEYEHYILYLQGEKVCVCGLAEVLCPIKSLDLQVSNPPITNPQS